MIRLLAIFLILTLVTIIVRGFLRPGRIDVDPTEASSQKTGSRGSSAASTQGVYETPEEKRTRAANSRADESVIIDVEAVDENEPK